MRKWKEITEMEIKDLLCHFYDPTPFEVNG